MNCLPCFSKDEEDEGSDQQALTKREAPAPIAPSKESVKSSSSNAQAFTFRELAMATKNFRQECLLGEGGFGRVFKGKLQSTGQVVAVKQLDRNGMQGNKEFLVEIMMLSLLQHQNLVNLVGYCADGDQRLLVYEFMPMGSLEDHLFGADKKQIDWYTRMKIASGTAKGLEYLHDKASPPIIYRDLKPSNILLDESYEPRLSDFGLAKLGAGGGKINPTSRVMGTYGYSAPEYSSSGELTLKSDIYSFGVVLLELITGRKVIDTNRPNDEQNLVTWAQPIFREPKRFPEMADPRLNKEFPVTGLNQAVGICAMCLQEEASVRPLIGDVVAALSFLSVPQPHDVHASVPAVQKSFKDDVANAFTPPPEQKMHYGDELSQNQATKPTKDNNLKCDESSSDDSDTEEKPNEESSQNSVLENLNHSGRESGRDSERLSVEDHSEEESCYSEEDSSTEDSDNNGKDETRDPSTVDTNVNRLNSGHSNSKKSEVGNLSSNHGSGRRSSSTKRTGSRRRKMVVTFKEPNLSSKRNRSKKVEENDDSSPHSQPVAGADISKRQSSSSSSESSSESDDEKGSSSRHQGDGTEAEDEPSSSHENPQHRGSNNSSLDSLEDHRVFDKSAKDVPKLRHLQTR